MGCAPEGSAGCGCANCLGETMGSSAWPSPAHDPEIAVPLLAMGSQPSGAPPPSGCVPDDFQDAYEYYDCRDIAKYGTPIGYPSECTRIDVPDSAWDRDCAFTDWTGWRNGEDCPEPYWNITTQTKACNHSSEEVDELTRLAEFTDCEGNFLSLVRKGWCLLVENMDLVDWVICRVYGPGQTCLQGILKGERETNFACRGLEEGRTATADLLGVRLNPYADALVFQRHMFANGSKEERLCAVLWMAELLFHELQHYCFLGGFATGDRTSDDCEGGGDDTPWYCHKDGECEPVWIASNTLRTLLRMRYPRARAALCCDTCLSETFFSNSNPVLPSSCQRESDLVVQGA